MQNTMAHARMHKPLELCMVTIDSSCMYMVLLLKLRESAGLLQGSCSSVIRASTAKIGGLGFDSQLATHAFFSRFVSILIYHQLLLIVSVCMQLTTIIS